MFTEKTSLGQSERVLIGMTIVTLFFLLSSLDLSFARNGVLAQESECKTLQECQALLREYEKQISQYESDIGKTQAEAKTLQNKISTLKKKVEKLELEIKKSNLVVKDLEFQIQDTKSSIDKTSQRIEDSKAKLAGILRQFYEEDQKSDLEIFLSGETLSSFFETLVALESLSQRNYQILGDIKRLKSDLQTQEENLDQEKGEWEQMVKIQTLQRQENQKTKAEQEWVLKETRGKESEYQKLLQESRAQAKKIRERMFELVGVPEAPTFGQALEMAKYIETVTGVRPAFLLAVLTQESNIGKNVGQCYLKDSQTGAGLVASSGESRSKVMHPERDVPIFLSVVKELGRDPYETLVSCPMSFGWGGAMGPAQFIPSTWARYKNRVSALTGKPADPWNIKDSFLAAAFLLKDSGADKQTYESERQAAMIYFSGSTNAKYSFYGNSVMSIAKGYEEDIERLEKFALNN